MQNWIFLKKKSELRCIGKAPAVHLPFCANLLNSFFWVLDEQIYVHKKLHTFSGGGKGILFAKVRESRLDGFNQPLHLSDSQYLEHFVQHLD